jgi:hypothetical protein
LLRLGEDHQPAVRGHVDGFTPGGKPFWSAWIFSLIRLITSTVLTP